MKNQSFLKLMADIFPECKEMKVIAENCCCAMCSLWFMGIDDLLSSLDIIRMEMKNGGLDSECVVQWQPFFFHVAGREIKVEFRKITGLSDLKDVKGKCIVKYEKGKNGHWVGVEKGKIAFNSLDYSKCVEEGKPTEARIITYI